MWRLAQSLATLRTEVNGYAPKRSKAADGTIGDQAHSERASRHNANRYHVVTAIDLTHDPAGGCDIHAIARRLVKDPHPELEYVISNGQVAKRRNGWRWEKYRGANAHRQHAHFAVGTGPDSDPLPPYDSTRPWGVALAAQPEPPEDDMFSDDDRKLLRGMDARLKAVEKVVAQLDSDVDDNLPDQVGEIRRNLRKTAAAAGVPADQIEK